MKRPICALAASAALVAVAALGAAGQDEQVPSGPAWFSGTSTGQPIVFDPITAFEPGVWMDARDGEVHGITIETDDPRFSGEWSYTYHKDEWPVSLGEREETVAVERHTIRLDNDAGAWTGNGTLIQHYLEEGGVFLEGASDALHVLEGEDAYDGLTAYVTFDFMTDTGGPDIRGVILPEEPTSFPEPPTPAESTD
jgi:hypothetical protein